MDLPAEEEAAIARRKAIQIIMKDNSLSPSEKQKKVQDLMTGKIAPSAVQENVGGMNGTPGHSQLSSLERDVAAKQMGRAPAASRPGAVSVASGGGGNEAGLSALERDVMAKQRGKNTGPSVPGAQSVGEGELSQLERDVQAKQRARPTGVSVPGAQSVGQGELSQLERDVQAKQRARPTGVSVPGAQSAGQGELSQLERDVQAKQRARPTGPSIPGAQPSAGQGELSQLERDVQAKQRARPTGVSVPGAQASSGQGELSQMERDIQAKQRERPTGPSVLGAQSTGQGELSQLERDVQAKQIASGGLAAAVTPGAYQAASAAAAPDCGLSQLERDIQAKQRSLPVGAQGYNTSGGLSQLESDIAAKQRGARPPAASLVPVAQSSGQSQLSQLESDVTAKNRARPAGAATAPGAQAASNGGRSELGSFENDVMAKNRARAERTAATSPTLSMLEQDVMAKNQARAPPTASAGCSSGAIELSAFEQDIAAKNRARPSSLMADNNITVGAASARNDLYAFENSISHKSPYGGMGPPPFAERSPLFDNVAASSGRSMPMHEISRLDERIAQKSSASPPQQQPQHPPPSQMLLHESPPMDSAPAQPLQLERNYDNLYQSDDYTKTSYGEKGDSPEDGIERARDDKEGYAGDGRTPGGEGGIVAPAGDMEYGEINLAVATAIEEDDEDMFIPAAVQYDPDAKPPMYKNRRFRLYGIAGIFFLIAVIVVAIVITQVAPSGPSGPTMAPTSFRESLGIEQQIIEIFGSDYLDDESSTQYKALQWLINEDPFEIQPNAENLIQRFILVYLYFETTKEGEWISCGKPEGVQPDSCYYMFLVDTYVEPWSYNELYWTRWLTGGHECEWAGVTCHSDKVTDINLDGFQLTGTFPLELTKLDYLRDISMSHNSLRGTLPRELAQMKHLTDIELQRNQFTGTIPHEWFSARNLIHVNFATNRISGTIPSEFGLLTDLQRMFIQFNNLVGSIPAEVFEMTSLKWMFLGNNRITGSLPPEIGQLTNMEYMYMEGNPITGTIPSEMGRLTEMRELDLHDTLLSGTIPEEFFTGLWEMINMIDVTDCNLVGTISPSIAGMRTLDWVLIANNQFTGPVPAEFGDIEALNRIQIQGNQFTGSIPQTLCQRRGDGSVYEVIADCAATSTGETPVYCPPGCCTECCNQDTGICLEAAT